MVPRKLSDAWVAFGVTKKKPERWVKITRDPSKDTGTTGVLKTDSGLSLYSLELPDRENKDNLSSIPAGEYECHLGDFPKHGKCYEVRGVKDRDTILFHVGNFAGDVEKGYRTDAQGCILVGNALGEVYDSKAGKKQEGLLGSKDGYARFVADLNGEAFTLTIEAKNAPEKASS